MAKSAAIRSRMKQRKVTKGTEVVETAKSHRMGARAPRRRARVAEQASPSVTMARRLREVPVREVKT